jgi:lipopolysaccharide transport system ATP-binding protein
LIVDEVLAVGDAEFQKKCIGKMNDVSKGEGRTVLFVSHSIGSIMQLCNKGLLLSQGKVEQSGNLSDVINKYLSHSNGLSSEYIREESDRNSVIYISSVTLSNNSGLPTSSFKYSEPIIATINLNLDDKLINTGIDNLSNCSLFLTVLDSNKQRIFSAEQSIVDGQKRCVLEIEAKFLSNGQYSFHIFIHTPGIARYDELEDVCQFEITDDDSIFLKYHGYDHGKVFGNYKWRQ